MNFLVCNLILLKEQPCGVWNFSLELVFELICRLNNILYFYLFSFFNFCNFVFVDNMILWVLMAEMLG